MSARARPRSPQRNAAVIALLTLFAIAVAVASLATYADRVLFDSSRFADRAQTALREPAVQRGAGALITRTALRAQPDLIAVEPLLRSVAEGVAGSPAFGVLVRGAVFQVHASVFSRENDTFALTVANARVLVVDALKAQGIDVGPDVRGIRTRLVTVSDGPAGRAATDVLQAADRVKLLRWIALAVAAAALLGALVLSADRRLLVRRAALALAATGAVLLAAIVVARAAVVGQVADPAARDAVREVWDVYLGDLRTWSVLLLAAGLIVAAAADAVLRPIGVGERVRRIAGGIASVPSRPAVRAVRALAFVAAGVLVLTAPATALQLVELAGGALLVALGVEELLWMTAPAPAPAPASGADRPPRVPLRQVVIPGGVAILALAGLASLAVATDHTGDRPPVLTTGCDGARELCGRRLDRVVFPATHNSMSSPQDDFLLANQEAGIDQQLRDGIRGLLIDTHLGVATPRGVYTVLQHGDKSRAKIEGAIGPAATRRAEALRRQIGYTGGGTPEVYLCHGFCELGAIRADTALAGIRDFLIAHPSEVLVLSIEDDVTPQQTADVFRRSGLLELVWKGPVRPLPTLQQMVDRDQRVLVMGEDHTAGVPWYHAQFDLVQDTPYDLRTVSELLSGADCVRNRGQAGNPMLLLNLWVAAEPPRLSDARRVNGERELVRHARACSAALGAPPTLVAVDFYREGDVVGAARALNGLPPQR
ncbi:MAG TPA: hypothetical protein VFT50_03815 [Baekduia sp.]|nr:hypothetical protein [Baekduia sp.]